MADVIETVPGTGAGAVTLEVKESVKELMYDIMNKTHLTGKSREAEGSKNYEASSRMQASEDDDNSYQLRRSLQTAYTSLKSLLGDYIDEDKTTSNNLLSSEIDGDGILVLSFKMPSNYNKSSTDSLGAGIHAYLVDKALADWFAITNREDAQTYENHSAASLEIVRRALYKRSRPTRPAIVIPPSD